MAASIKFPKTKKVVYPNPDWVVTLPGGDLPYYFLDLEAAKSYAFKYGGTVETLGQILPYIPPALATHQVTSPSGNSYYFKSFSQAHKLAKALGVKAEATPSGIPQFDDYMQGKHPEQKMTKKSMQGHYQALKEWVDKAKISGLPVEVELQNDTYGGTITRITLPLYDSVIPLFLKTVSGQQSLGEPLGVIQDLKKALSHSNEMLSEKSELLQDIEKSLVGIAEVAGLIPGHDHYTTHHYHPALSDLALKVSLLRKAYYMKQDAATKYHGMLTDTLDTMHDYKQRCALLSAAVDELTDQLAYKPASKKEYAALAHALKKVEAKKWLKS